MGNNSLPLYSGLELKCWPVFPKCYHSTVVHIRTVCDHAAIIQRWLKTHKIIEILSNHYGLLSIITITIIIIFRLTVEAAHCFGLMTFSWAPEVDGGVDYFLVLTDSACFHIYPGFISSLSDVVCIKHIQESTQIFSICVRKRSTGVARSCSSLSFLWKDSLSACRLALRKHKIIKVLKARWREMISTACFSLQNDSFEMWTYQTHFPHTVWIKDQNAPTLNLWVFFSSPPANSSQMCCHLFRSG